MNFRDNIAGAVKESLLDPRFTSRNQLSSGRVFFVLKTAATNYTQFVEDHPAYKSGDGVVTTDAVYNTVAAAVAACTADQGDIIYVMPGHTETVTATSLDLDVAGITIICLGTGGNVPFFTYDAAASTIDVTAADVKWVGGIFFADKLDVVEGFAVAAAKDFRLENAVFQDKTSILNFLDCVRTTTTDNDADGLTILNCSKIGLNTTPLAFISILGDIARLTVQGNFVDSASTADVGHFITFAAKDSVQTRIMHNQLFVVGVTTAAVGIFLTGSGTSHSGIVAYNLVTSLDTTGELIATAGTGLAFFENYYTGVADKSGKLWPVVDAA